MLLGRNESPFPENPHCKRCASKNCRELLVQPLFPGKVIFVHRRQFCSNPDYIPTWRNEESAAPAAQETALTDELEVTEGVIELSAPTWEHKDDENIQDYPEKALEGAKIVLSAQVKNYPDGAPVTFDIYDTSENTPLLIKSIKGTNEGGTATAEWEVEDPQLKGDNLKIAIEATARSKSSQRSDIPYLAKLKCDFIEMPDVLFNHNSAVPCLDTDGILLSALSSAFAYAKNNPDRETVLFGHTDTSGKPDYNYDLSQWRSEGIKAFIDNDVNLFLDTVSLASKVEDYQTFLASLAKNYSWKCDPGTIDNVAGEKTKAAIKSFQEEYKKRFNKELTPDGIMGDKTWTALFEVTRSLLEETVKKECGDIPPLTYGYNGKGIYPCGESFPVDQIGVDGIKSKTNRRVEIVFFEKGKSGELKAPADKKKVEKKEAAVYDKRITKILPVQTKAVEKGTGKDADPDIFDKDLFLFSPAMDTYYRVDADTVPDFYTAVDECNKFIEDINDARKLASDAAVKKLGEIKDGFVKYLKEQHQKASSSEESSAMGKADAGIDGDLKELICLNIVGQKTGKNSSKPNYKGWVYVRSDKIKSHWRKSQGKTLEKLFGPEEKEDKGLKAELKEKFKEKILAPLKQEKVLLGSDEEKDILAPKWVFSADNAKSNSQHWDLSAGAQFLRFSAGASLKSEVNLTNLEVKIEAAGSASFALAEGKAESSLYIPDKDGFNLPELLSKTEEKIKTLLTGSGDKKPLRTTFTSSERQIMLRMKLGLKVSGFVGASASIAFPRIEIKPVKGNDPKSERMALATLEGKAFAGAKAEAELSGDISWSSNSKPSDKDWKSMITASGSLAGSIGIGAEGKFHFGYKDGHIRFCCAVQATFVVGGKGSWDFDLGLVEGLEFIAALSRCVDYHYIAEISEELWETLGAYKYACLISPAGTVALGSLYVLKDIDQHADTAKKFVNEAKGLYQQVTNFVDKTVQNKIFGVDKTKLEVVKKQVEAIKSSPPETIARYLLVIMKVREEDDFMYITETLNVLESDHEFRWVLRFVGLLTTLHEVQMKTPTASSITFKGVSFQVKNATVIASNEQLRKVMESDASSGTGKEKDVMLEKAVDVLRTFGKDKDTFLEELENILNKNGVK
jgi:outer membrane protein OmpA-like peptidoglycan-associated protein